MGRTLHIGKAVDDQDFTATPPELVEGRRNGGKKSLVCLATQSDDTPRTRESFGCGGSHLDGYSFDITNSFLAAHRTSCCTLRTPSLFLIR